MKQINKLGIKDTLNVFLCVLFAFKSITTFYYLFVTLLLRNTVSRPKG